MDIDSKIYATSLNFNWVEGGFIWLDGEAIFFEWTYETLERTSKIELGFRAPPDGGTSYLSLR
jgi:hypothetical protein